MSPPHNLRNGLSCIAFGLLYPQFRKRAAADIQRPAKGRSIVLSILQIMLANLIFRSRS